MIGYIYMTTNLINGKKYIGKRVYPKFDKYYYGSGNVIKSAIKKYGIENFQVEVLEEINTNKQDLLEAEIRWQKKYNAVENPNFYNLMYGQHRDGIPHSEETRHKISESQKGKKQPEWYHSEEFSELVKEGMKNGKQRIAHVYTEEENKQNSERLKAYFRNGGVNGMTGRKHSEETRQKIKEKALQRPSLSGEQTSCFNKKTVNNGVINKMVPKDEVEAYLALGWNLGRVKKV